MNVPSASTLISCWESISRIWIRQNNKWSEMAAVTSYWSSEWKKGSWVSYYSTALLLCLEILGILLAAAATTHPKHQAPCSLYSPVPIRSECPLCRLFASCVPFLQLALRVAVVTRYRLVDIWLIKSCKVQGKKRLTSNCLTAYLIWANTSYNTIDGVIVLF